MVWLHLSVRVLHVLLGVFWAGAVFFVMLYLDPAVRATAPEGGKVMGAIQRRGYLRVMITVGTLTVVTGLYLLWRYSAGFSSSFMGSLPGMLLSTGMLAGILALAVGVHVSRPAANKLGALMEKITAGEAPPSPEDMVEVRRLQDRLTLGVRIVAVLLFVAVVTMALGPHV